MLNNFCFQWSKVQWKRETKKKVRAKCDADLKEKMKGYSKLRDGPMFEEDFGMKDYVKNMKVEDARVNFSLRSKMVAAKFNYRNDPKYSAELWRCSSCMSGHIESQSHLLYCDAYADLRADKDINNNSDLVEYIKNVLTVREKLGITKWEVPGCYNESGVP